jgi:hypothetical protein
MTSTFQLFAVIVLIKVDDWKKASLADIWGKSVVQGERRKWGGRVGGWFQLTSLAGSEVNNEFTTAACGSVAAACVTWSVAFETVTVSTQKLVC